jgi:hypothetical protein
VKTGRHSKSPCNDLLPSKGKSIDVLESGKRKAAQESFQSEISSKIASMLFAAFFTFFEGSAFFLTMIKHET